MKKIIIGLSGLIVLAFIIIGIANGQIANQKTKKAATEATKECSKCSSGAGCTMMTASKTKAKACDMAKCKEMGCDPAKCKEGKCDPEKCKMTGNADSKEIKKCDSSSCGMMSQK